MLIIGHHLVILRLLQYRIILSIQGYGCMVAEVVVDQVQDPLGILLVVTQICWLIWYQTMPSNILIPLCYHPDTNIWTWVDGTSDCAIGRPPSPGQRSEHALFIDSTYRVLYLHSGAYDWDTLTNDLWIRGIASDTTQSWRMLSSDSAPYNYVGDYRTMNVASSTNWPIRRQFGTPNCVASYQDTHYFYGGHGPGDSEYWLADLWSLRTIDSPTTIEWIWLFGELAEDNIPPNYGTLGIEAPNNTMGSRAGASVSST
jgi:hypothetical protein